MDKHYIFACVNFFPGDYKHWQAAYDELAIYVGQKELTTITYYFGLPFDNVDDPESTTLMFAFEQYSEKSALTDTHFNSPAMQKFLKIVPQYMSTGLDIINYDLTSGFLDKPGDMSECKTMQDIQIYCKSPEARASVVKRLEKVSAAAEKGDAGIYTYMTFKAQDNDTQIRIYSRYQDRATMEKHTREKEVIDFWTESKEDIERMDHRAYFPNGKGWLHR